MYEIANIGVFLCRCGNQIDPHIDLKTLEQTIAGSDHVGHCEILSYPCLQPGVDHITQQIIRKKLNRIIVAGCEGRLMNKKFEKAFADLELHKGQIDMVNLRGHVAAVSDQTAVEKANKSAKLVNAAIAEMTAMRPTQQTMAKIDGPVMVVGDGIASYTAAQSLAQKGIDYFLAVSATDPEAVVRHLHCSYPGERPHYDRIKKIVSDAVTSTHATVIPPGKLTGLSGVTGDYTLRFELDGEESPIKYKSGAIIACLDAQMAAPGPEFGYDGNTVMTQPEMEELMWENGAPKGSILFWVNDDETGQSDFAQLSAITAWHMARHIRECSTHTQTMILYHQDMEIPLSASERVVNRKLGILWIPYDKAIQPTVQDSVVTFCSLTDHVEHELNWDYLVLSPIRLLGKETAATAEILGLVHKEERFLTGHHAKVRPEMVGREETYMAGSARYPCDLQESLNQGRRAGTKTAEMVKNASEGRLRVPRVVCVVDPDLCIGCGQCQELCDCGGIGIVDGTRGGLPRVVDPMVCTGGGTCAAACPYHALTLQNNSNDQREARVASLAGQLAQDEVMAIGCVWGGLPAADNAGKKGLKYDPRVHILGVPCVGQIDPCIMARALMEGAPGVILVGCLPEECHHSYGVDHAWSRVNVIKKLLTLAGFNRQRIALAHADLNKPEEFILTVESFARTIALMGPIPRSADNVEKLESIYDLIRNNTRVRHLLSAGLRRPWEKDYRGDQRHALEYDRDFSAVLEEEYLGQRLVRILADQRQALRLADLAAVLKEDEAHVADCLWGLVTDGAITLSHENREAFYSFMN
ncbi:MAG: hydrogenase iron-sulfur subunit [Desulfobacteraceae bacterium]|nr:hydrogenase iron-sulfur subunit [Desulfobacteraceae bacterium]